MDDIVRIQKACKPESPVPLERDDNPHFHLEELRNFLKQGRIDPSTELETIWRKTTHYAEQREISHKQFLLGLSSFLTEDAFEFLKDQPRNAKLADIATEFANR